MLLDIIYPKQVEIRGTKISIMEQEMAKDPLVRIQYSGKSFGMSNGWKKWIGEIQSLRQVKGVEKKEAFEEEFARWVSVDPPRTAKYGKIHEQYDEIYRDYQTYYIVNIYTSEVFFSNGAESVGLAERFRNAVAMASAKDPKLQEELSRLGNVSSGFFKNYNSAVDKRLFAAVMKLYGENIAPEWQTQAYKDLSAKCRGDFASITDKLFAMSIFTDEKKVKALLKNFDPRAVQKDPFYILASAASELLETRVIPRLSEMDGRLAGLLNKQLINTIN